MTLINVVIKRKRKRKNTLYIKIKFSLDLNLMRKSNNRKFEIN